MLNTTILSQIGHNESDIKINLSSENKDLLTEIFQCYTKEELDSPLYISAR